MGGVVLFPLLNCGGVGGGGVREIRKESSDTSHLALTKQNYVKHNVYLVLFFFVISSSPFSKYFSVNFNIY